MTTLPRSAQYYLVGTWFVACTLLVASLFAQPQPTVHWLWLLAWMVAFVLSDYFNVTFDVGNNNRVAISLSESVFLFLVAIAGISGVFVVALGTTIVQVLQKRPWYRHLFNSAHRTITFTLMFAAYQALQNPTALPYGGAWGIVVFLLVAVVFHLSNTVLVGTMMALVTRQKLGVVYRSSFGLVRWVHLLSLPLGALMAALWYVDRFMILFGLVSLVIAQRAFAAMAQLHVELQRNQELAEERERLLDELKAQQEELIRASKLSALGTFASGIAHEFNNLLTVVLGQAQIGLVTNDLDEMRESLDSTVKVCRRGRSITQGLLTFARQGETQRVMTQIREITDDTLKMVEHDFERENIHIIRQLEPVPPTYSDPGQLMQVLLNMLTNARDAMRDIGGGIITLSMRQDANQIVLSIADTGTGMPPEVQRQIFQPFVTTKGAKGTGLGLAICYGIIESHNGSIQVSSTFGKGTTMTIRLPIVERNEPAIRITQQEAARIASTNAEESVHI